MKSLVIACRKGTSVSSVERITDSISSQAESEFEREIPSIVLGKKVMEALVKLDEVLHSICLCLSSLPRCGQL